MKRASSHPYPPPAGFFVLLSEEFGLAHWYWAPGMTPEALEAWWRGVPAARPGKPSAFFDTRRLPGRLYLADNAFEALSQTPGAWTAHAHVDDDSYLRRPDGVVVLHRGHPDSVQNRHAAELVALGLPPVLDPATVAEALDLAAGATDLPDTGHIPLLSALIHRVEHADKASIRAALDAAFRLDQAWVSRFGAAPRDLWAAITRRVDDPRALVRHAELLAAWPASALEALRRARHHGARGLAEVIGWNELLCGEVTTAAHTLRRPSTPRGIRLRQIATSDAPLVESDCQCGAPPSGDVPPSSYLKRFYETWDDLSEEQRWLCLGCHTIWERARDDVGPNRGWSWRRTSLSGLTRAAAWDRGWGGQFPGEDAVRDLPAFVRWVKALKEPVYAGSLP